MLNRLFLLCAIIFMTGPLSAQVKTGADQLDKVIPLLSGKRVGLIVNQTSLLSGTNTHLLDTLLSKGIDVKRIFAPEHGFRGQADAGETVIDSKDKKTGLPITSLYGKNKKPSAAQVADMDILLFDIQDVGTRFYTYISTLYYAMQTCAEENKMMVVLDRPNPNDYIDGPIIKPELKSFVGALSIPVLHGVTVAELAQMINGEGWVGKQPAQLKVVTVKGWKHGDAYSLPVKPSPNLPNDQAIKLYPSLCFFEATDVSIGRGTYFPFQAIGYPDKRFGEFTFTPVSLPGYDKKPLQQDKLCYGSDLRNVPVEGGLSLSYLIDFYNQSGQGEKFITRPLFFDKLMGDTLVRQDLKNGKTEKEIKARWEDDLKKYKDMRKKYLLYQE